ncbi:MAG: hypothetical protein ABIQ73_08440 [Acidimicrobiales bacterium]
MSQTVILSVGFVVFALTVWGAIMAGGIWFSQLAESDDNRSGPGPVIGIGIDETDRPPQRPRLPPARPFAPHE